MEEELSLDKSRGSYLPRKTDEEKKLLISRILGKFMDSEDTMRQVLEEYQLGKSSFYDWVNELGMDIQLKTAQLIRSKSVPIDYNVFREQLKEVPTSIKLKFTKSAALYARGMSRIESMRAGGAEGRYYLWKDQFDVLKIIDAQASKDREFLDLIRREEAYELASDALIEKLKHRKKKTIKRKKGTVVVGNRLMDVENVTQEMQDVEPDMKAIELVMKREGQLDKKVVIDGEITVHKPFSEKEEQDWLTALNKDLADIDLDTDTNE